MPSLDVARGRARLSLQHVAVLGALLATEPVSDELKDAHKELLNTGLIGTDGVPTAAVGPLVRVLASAWLRIDVETWGAGGLVGHGAWVAGTEAVTAEGWPGQDELEFAPLEPAMLPWAIARIVGLRRNPIPEQDAPVVELRTTLRTVDGAIRALTELPDAGGDATRAAIHEVLEHDRRLEDAEREMLADVLVNHRVSWRVVTSWPASRPGAQAQAAKGRPDTGDTGGTGSGAELQGRSLAVLDAGSAGYWRRDDPTYEQHTALGLEAPVVLVRRTAADLWRELVALLPGAASDHPRPS